MIVAIGEVVISLLGVIVILQSRGGNNLLFDELDVLFCDDDDDVDDAIERDVDDVDVDDAVDNDNEGICCCCIDSSSSPSASRSSLEFLKGE